MYNKLNLINDFGKKFVGGNMGGSGSGQWYRWNKKSFTNDFNNFSMKRLVELGVVKDNHCRSGSWQWLSGGEVVSSISYNLNTINDGFPYIQLIYTNKDSNEKFNYKVRLTTTTPHYGGKRWWFICPSSGCGRRVGVLYSGKAFACRHWVIPPFLIEV